MDSCETKKINHGITLPNDEMYKSSSKMNKKMSRYHKLSNKIATEKIGNYGPLPVEIITGKSFEEIISP